MGAHRLADLGQGGNRPAGRVPTRGQEREGAGQGGQGHAWGRGAAPVHRHVVGTLAEQLAEPIEDRALHGVVGLEVASSGASRKRA